MATHIIYEEKNGKMVHMFCGKIVNLSTEVVDLQNIENVSLLLLPACNKVQKEK